VGGGVPSPLSGSVEGWCPSPEFFLSILDLKLATSGAFWIFFKVQLFGLNAKGTVFRLGQLDVACNVCRSTATRTSLPETISIVSFCVEWNVVIKRKLVYLLIFSYVKPARSVLDGWRGEGRGDHIESRGVARNLIWGYTF